MKSFRTQRITWATDWPVIRTTTPSPTPPPSTRPSLFCPSTLTTHSQPQPRAAAPPPPQKTPTLLPHTPQPSLNTPQYKVWPPHLREWQRTLFPKSSTSENKQIKPNLNPKPFLWAWLWILRQPLCTSNGSGSLVRTMQRLWNFLKLNLFGRSG